MKILILVAMDKELRLLLPMIENAHSVEIDKKEYWKGTICHHDVLVGKCGIGKVNSALATLRLIQEFQPDLVVNTGVAGGASGDIHPLDVVVAEQVAYHDVWCGPGTEYGAADGFPVRMDADKKIVEAAKKGAIPVKTGLICSGDKFIDAKEQIEEISGRFPDVLAVDMESASIMQTAASQGVACAIIRVISDSPFSGDNFAEYVNFWDDAPAATFQVLREVLEAIEK